MNSKKIFVIISLILFFLVTVTQAKKIATLSEIAKPYMMLIGNDRIYISENLSIYIYSLEDFRLIKKFGKQGEGPQEFKILPTGWPLKIIPFYDKLYVNSHTKLSIFTKDGEFIKESKTPYFFMFWPFNNKFVSLGYTVVDKGQMFLAVALHNEKFKKLKNLYVSDFTPGGTTFKMEFPLHPIVFHVYKDHVYSIRGKEGFVIEVFDYNGNKVNRIKKDSKPIKLTEFYKKKTVEWFETSPGYKQYWKYLKTKTSFRTHFPPTMDMWVKDGRIYLLTYKRKNGDKGDVECIIMDLKGNEQKRAFVPYPILYGFDYQIKCDIYKRAFYLLVENEDEESWELHKYDTIK
jgi:hypothetical protein